MKHPFIVRDTSGLVMRQKLAEYRTFWREFRENYHTTGSLMPSSRVLAGKLARYVGKCDRPQHILEVGPGTGAVTCAILRRLRTDDRLDLVELNESFCNALRKRFETEPLWSNAEPRCRLIHAPVEELSEHGHYDLIVSGLPLNNFEVQDVDQILRTFRRLLKPDGTLSFFQYIAIRAAKSLVSGQNHRRRLKGIGQVLHDLFQKGEIKRDWIWRNVPPAWVHHVRFNGARVESSAEPAVAAPQQEA